MVEEKELVEILPTWIELPAGQTDLCSVPSLHRHRQEPGSSQNPRQRIKVENFKN